MKTFLWVAIGVGFALVLRTYWRANAVAPDHQRDRNPMVKPTTTVVLKRVERFDNEAE